MRAAVLTLLATFAGVSLPSDAAELVPERMLRAWDPVTIFFDRDVLPSSGVAPVDPGAVLDSWPRHPGAFEWVDRRTLQFRPAEPWPPLVEQTWSVGGQSWTLHALLDPPVASVPEPHAKQVLPLDALSLTFRGDITAEQLAGQLRIALRPAPGVSDDRVRWLDGTSLDIKILDRHIPDAPSTAIIRLPEAVPESTHVSVSLRLDRDSDAALWQLEFETAPAFRVVRLGCANSRYPVPSEGVEYGPEAALSCEGDVRQIAVEFSSELGEVDAVVAHQLIRITPAVEDLQLRVADRTLLMYGAFDARRAYRLSLHHADLADAHGKPLRMSGASAAYVTFPEREPFVRLGAGRGIVERFGAQHLPLSGRSEDRIDVRVHRIEPLDRNFWPFPDEPVVVDESVAPPGPGERPPAFNDPDRHADATEIAARIKSLGTPARSTILHSPLRRGGSGARFGLDLKPILEELDGSASPGTYLVGLRRLGGEPSRAWMRVQVTDLAFSTVAAQDSVRFQVSSLRSGLPVADARIQVQGWQGEGAVTRWSTFIDGRTDALGGFEWQARNPGPGGRVMRVVVSAADDRLVLDPGRAPDIFRDGRWAEDRDDWLQWTRDSASSLRDAPEQLCHLFTERPVYRPEHVVHVKGWLRLRERGQFDLVRSKATLVVAGPGDVEWRYPLTLGNHGGFYHVFDEPDLPAGTYHARLEITGWQDCGALGFKKEDYKLPEFEVRLHGPDRVPLDADFSVSATAHYYAGGAATDRELRWRVTQFPVSHAPATRPEFRFSSQTHFGAGAQLSSENVLEVVQRTDASGAGRISVNPGLEASAAPRRYVFEATVSGADGRTVTATRQVLGLPAFVLGLRVPRVIRQANSVRAHAIALGPDGDVQPDVTVEVRLLKREWHAHLRAGDYSSGVAKYVTEAVDRLVYESTTRTGSSDVAVDLPLSGSGVYLVELAARDALGRLQVVRADFFAAGDEPVTWSRPPAQVFQLSADKDSYLPGEVATLVLESPYQSAHALVVTEAPDGNRYRSIQVENGTAMVDVPIVAAYAPRLPVHVLLMRGRVADSPPAGGLDPGRPATLAATRWLTVEPREHRLSVALSHPPRARPGEFVTVKVALRDGNDRPVPGEVTLWLVDQAVLALGREQRLDPLADFLRARDSRVAIHDTRNLLFGYLPFEEYPGGGAGDTEPSDLLDNVTVRRRFVAVPFYADAVAVGASGEAEVQVQLPDNLTNFKVRAKAVSGTQRFGYATGQLAVRLPLIVQPALPRFVRPGDRFEAGATVRVVDGPSGAALAAARFDGLVVQAPATQAGGLRAAKVLDTHANAAEVLDTHEPPADSKDIVDTHANAAEVSDTHQTAGAEVLDTHQTAQTPITLVGQAPLQVAWTVDVPGDAAGQVQLSVAVERTADAVADAFSVTLPVRPDRAFRSSRTSHRLASGARIEIPALDEAVRSGTLERSLRVSTEPALLALADAVGFLASYPYGCTEQRIAQARGGLALRRFGKTVALGGASQSLDLGVDQTLEWIAGARDDNGLVAYWPGSKGYVSLTAWSLQLVVAAREAGHEAPADLERDLVHRLRQALRSDYPLLIAGSEYAERAWALAALADAGVGDAGYAAELAARAQFFALENLAQVVRTLARDGDAARTQVEGLGTQLWSAINTRLQEGQIRYLGLNERSRSDGLILPGEARTLAEMLRTAVRLDAREPRRLLTDALVTLADRNGWGDTNANASALEALAEVLDLAGPETPVLVRVTATDGEAAQLSLRQAAALGTWTTASTSRISLEHRSAGAAGVGVVSQARYLPEASGAQARAHAAGFVVRREWARIGASDAPLERLPLTAPGASLSVAVGDLIEERIELVNPVDRHHVALTAPLAAGLEPLNPRLATAPPEARASLPDSLLASYSELRDDRVAWYFDNLPKGTYRFAFRVRAVTRGQFVQPPAQAELMYDPAISGTSHGARVVVRTAAPPAAVIAPEPSPDVTPSSRP